MDLMQGIIARAKANKQRIVLPEGTEERTIKAADRLIADGVADVILIGNPGYPKVGYRIWSDKHSQSDNR